MILIMCVVLLTCVILILWLARLVMRWPSRAKRHMTTALIVVNHAQNLALIGSMQLEWPEILVQLYSLLRLDLLPFVHIECFVQGDLQTAFFWLASYSESLLMLILLNALWLRRAFAPRIDWTDIKPERIVTLDMETQSVNKKDKSRQRSCCDVDVGHVRVDVEDAQRDALRIPARDKSKLKQTRGELAQDSKSGPTARAATPYS